MASISTKYALRLIQTPVSMTFSSVVVDAEWLYSATADEPSSPAERIDVDAAFAQDEFDPFEMTSEQFFENNLRRCSALRERQTP